MGHGDMQWDEDRVLQFAGHKDDECSVLQQSFECFCWPSCEQIRSPTFKMLQLHLLRKFEKNEQVGVGVFFEMSKLFKWNFFRKMLLTYSLLKPENIIQKYLPVIKISNWWGILIWATLYTSAALSVTDGVHVWLCRNSGVRNCYRTNSKQVRV